MTTPDPFRPTLAALEDAAGAWSRLTAAPDGDAGESAALDAWTDLAAALDELVRAWTAYSA